MVKIEKGDVVGLVHPHIDVHNLGITSFSHILEDCGIRTELCDETISLAIENINEHNARIIAAWIKNKHITISGFSYRLDPDDAVRLFDEWIEFLKNSNLLASRGGPIRGLFFAGLPDACKKISARFPFVDACFSGDETIHETIEKAGIPRGDMPSALSSSLSYDDDRLAFGEDVIRSGKYFSVSAVDRHGYDGYGKRGDSVVNRIRHGDEHRLPPVIRVHAGPYLADRNEAVKLFIEWSKQLAKGGLLDVLSIGTSQLTQSNFGENWEGMHNGGGVPINSPDEYRQIWEASRPMLVRTYAGTKNVPWLAQMHEQTIDIAWHALSLWWFCKIDGRGPNTVFQNLQEHFDTMHYIASTNKPLEPNVPHHFAFRGTDDLGYVLSGAIAARAAKAAGIKTLILQIMLNTPKYTWGIQDLAKARAMLRLVKELEGPDFTVFIQPRGGLDYFSPDSFKAKTQLAAVTAMMDDIEPQNDRSPQIIHVVSYSEADRLADPAIIEESIKITRYALERYRMLKKNGDIADMTNNTDVAEREKRLYGEAKQMLAFLEKSIKNPYTPTGLYRMLKAGVFPLPWLTSCREEFPNAVAIQTRFQNGGVIAIDQTGSQIPFEVRKEMVRAALLEQKP